MDFHSHQIQGFFDIPVDHLSAMPVIVRYLRRKKLRKPVIVSPDSGGVKMAVEYAKMLGAGIAIGAKYRRGANEVDALNVVGEVAGCSAVIVDDLTSTASTLCESSRILQRMGAKEIYAVVSHPMIGPEGVRKLEASPIKELIVTDSIPLKNRGNFAITVLTVAGLLGEAVARIHSNRSVTSLFQL
jgi:ribose-phosphate pyrophosphokinase